jgi:hypothetical protein
MEMPRIALPHCGSGSMLHRIASDAIAVLQQLVRMRNPRIQFSAFNSGSGMIAFNEPFH